MYMYALHTRKLRRSQIKKMQLLHTIDSSDANSYRQKGTR